MKAEKSDKVRPKNLEMVDTKKSTKKIRPPKDTDPLALYLKQISRYPLLGIADEQEIGQKIQHARLAIVSLKEAYADRPADVVFIRESAKLEASLRTRPVLELHSGTLETCGVNDPAGEPCSSSGPDPTLLDRVARSLSAFASPVPAP